MIKWTEEMEMPVNIEIIWSLFELENMPKIMPGILETKIIEKKGGIVGSTYQQKYKEENKIETYIIEDLEHEDSPEKKHNKSGFMLGKVFEVESSITLTKLSENKTMFVYSGQNKGLTILGKVLLMLSGTKRNQKIVAEFMNRVKEESLKLKDSGEISNK